MCERCRILDTAEATREPGDLQRAVSGVFYHPPRGCGAVSDVDGVEFDAYSRRYCTRKSKYRRPAAGWAMSGEGGEGGGNGGERLAKILLLAILPSDSLLVKGAREVGGKKRAIEHDGVAQ